jgi:Fe2+ transport system protein FeoA
MSTTLENAPRTIHLTAEAPAAPASSKKTHKGLRLTDLHKGESARVTRLTLSDSSCRKRFAEMGLAEGMKVHVVSTGDTMMIALGSGTGSRIAVAARCAETIFVIRA